jgi:hypothetical protein
MRIPTEYRRANCTKEEPLRRAMPAPSSRKERPAVDAREDRAPITFGEDSVPLTDAEFFKIS